jgi:glycosyltransferase involved in cell wall biosynthesis
MKITHVIESGGGSATFVLYLIQYLPQHSHHVMYGDRTFFGKNFQEVKQNLVNATFYPWANVQRELKVFKDLKAAVSLYKMLKQIDSDVIHLHSSKAGFLGRLVCFFLGKKNVIYTPQGLSFVRKDISRLKASLYMMLEVVASRFTGKIICCSRSEAQELSKKGVACSYINNGTEIINYYSNHNKPENKAIIIATSGRATIQKNPKLFNQVAKHFENDHHFEFLWIGGGELEHELTSNNIKITGWQNESSVISTLASADIYISTASWEGLPLSVLEAMNLSKPLLMSNCVGNIDLVKTDYNGFIFDSVQEAVDRIRFFYENQELMRSFGNNSHQFALEEFNVKDMARDYETAYYSSNN